MSFFPISPQILRRRNKSSVESYATEVQSSSWIVNKINGLTEKWAVLYVNVNQRIEHLNSTLNRLQSNDHPKRLKICVLKLHEWPIENAIWFVNLCTMKCGCYVHKAMLLIDASSPNKVRALNLSWFRISIPLSRNKLWMKLNRIKN